MLKKTKNFFLIFLTAFGGLLSAAGLGFLCGTHTVYAAENDIQHAVCGKSDCGHDGHEDITYSPWTDAGKLPSYGNYYLVCDYENVLMTVHEGNTDSDKELNLDLNGFTIKSTKTSPTIEVYSRLNVCDSSAEQTGRIINTSAVEGSSAVRISETGTGFGVVNVYGGKIEGQFSGIYNNGRGTVTLYGGDISGNTNGIFSIGGTVNVSRADGATLTVSGKVGVSATGGRINFTDGVAAGTAYGLETQGTAAATVTGGTITGGEYDVYCASQSSQRRVSLENTPVFSRNPRFFVAYNASQPSDTHLNLLHYTFTDGAGEPVEVTLYTDVSQIAANRYLVNCTEEQSARINCGNDEMILEYEANGLKIVPVRARIDDVKYRALADAFADAELPANAGCTVMIVSDSTISDTVQISAAFTIDLNGHKITSNLDAIISANSGADITITDSVGGGALINGAGDAVRVDGGKVTLSSFEALSGVNVNFSSATAAEASLRLVNLPLDGNNKLKITLGADCKQEEYFALSDADYTGNIDFTCEGAGNEPYVLVYTGSDGAIKLHIHSYEEEFTVDTPATCTEAGSKSKHCTGCDASIEKTPIAATGHSWQSATCTQPRHCTACGSTQGAPLGHRWNEATCTQAKYCPVCETSEGEALGHRLGNWSVKTQPTEESEGEAEHTCSRCREKFSEVLPALTSESYTKTEVEATINANAYTEYSLEIGGKTVTFRIYKEGTKLTPSQTEGGDGNKSSNAKTATIVGIVCVAVFTLAVGAVVLYIYGVFDKKRRRR